MENIEFKAGIYLEFKKSTIGTGHTAKSVDYKNFWMALTCEGNMVECILLDNDFNLTGFKEKFSLTEFIPPRFTYIPQGEKKYNILLKRLEQQVLAKPKPAAKTAPSPKPKAEAAKWWEGSSEEIPAGSFFENSGAGRKKEQPKKKKPQTGVVLKKTWWDK